MKIPLQKIIETKSALSDTDSLLMCQMAEWIEDAIKLLDSYHGVLTYVPIMTGATEENVTIATQKQEIRNLLNKIDHNVKD